MKKALILGAGVSGCTCAYMLRKKGFEVDIIEKTDGVGGLSRTNFFHGHPYEFGPHVWFWPRDRENKLVYDLSGGMYEVDRKLYTYTEDGLFRYPIHANEINRIAGAEAEMNQNRVGGKLDYSKLPVIGKCKFSEYFKAAIGTKLYDKFMKEYTHKMWGIPGEELETNIVWADRMGDQDEVIHYDPIKFEDHSLGKGLHNWYPKGPKGWNEVWDRMVDGCNVVLNRDLTNDCRSNLSGWIEKYDAIIVTVAPDLFLVEGGIETLPANGRLIVPLIVPGIDRLYPGESIHYADDSPATRTTDMKSITRYNSPDSLLLIEIPIDGTKPDAFPSNIMTPQNYCRRCYYHQTKEAMAKWKSYIDIAGSISSKIHFAGRHGMFRYWGMPETVENAINTVENI